MLVRKMFDVNNNSCMWSWTHWQNEIGNRMEPSNLRYVSQVAYALKYEVMSEINLKYNHLLGNYIKKIAEESYS